MCNMCRHNNKNLLLAMLLGATEPVVLEKVDPADPDERIEPEPLRIGLAAVLAAFGAPIKKDDIAGRNAAHAVMMEKVRIAFAPMTAAQIANLGRMCDDIPVAFEAVSLQGIVELQRRRDAGDMDAAHELMPNPNATPMPDFRGNSHLN